MAIALGILLGMVAPTAAVRAVNTFAALFDQFIKFMMPLIIVGLVTPAFAETGRGAGKIPVDYTMLKNVRKPSGSLPGKVIFEVDANLYTRSGFPARLHSARISIR